MPWQRKFGHLPCWLRLVVREAREGSETETKQQRHQRVSEHFQICDLGTRGLQCLFHRCTIRPGHLQNTTPGPHEHATLKHEMFATWHGFNISSFFDVWQRAHFWWYLWCTFSHKLIIRPLFHGIAVAISEYHGLFFWVWLLMAPNVQAWCISQEHSQWIRIKIQIKDRWSKLQIFNV